MPGVSLASNAIEFFSDIYDDWFYTSSWDANYFRQPRQPGFQGAVSYDNAHFSVFGVDTVKEVTASVMR